MASVLLVDDDPKIRELLRLYIEREGHRTIAAADGEMALAAALRALERDATPAPQDGMTADWARLPYDLIETISGRIVNEIAAGAENAATRRPRGLFRF